MPPQAAGFVRRLVRMTSAGNEMDLLKQINWTTAGILGGTALVLFLLYVFRDNLNLSPEARLAIDGALMSALAFAQRLWGSDKDGDGVPDVIDRSDDRE